MVNFALILSIFLLFSNCHKTVLTFQKDSKTSRDAGGAILQEIRSARQGSLVAGYYFLSEPIEVGCPNPKDIPEVKIMTGVWDSIVHGLVGGIYSTKTLEAYCEKERR